jgi:5-formyltetrahydrofolate cyclo-ligase
VKKELREKLRAVMSQIPSEDLHRRSAHAATLLFGEPEYQHAETMMIYLSLPREVDTTPIVLRAWQDGKRVVAPQVVWEGRQMIPIEIRSLEDDVADGVTGVREPIRGVPTPIETIDLVIVPGLGFDAFGNRLGRGRGFYDRFLSRSEFRGVPCGLALEEQVVTSIPAGPGDMRMKMLVTDQQVHRF